MPAAVTDKLRKTRSSGRPVPAYLTANKTIGAATASVNVATGWPTDTGIDLIIFRKDAAGVRVAGTTTTWVATLSGTTLSDLTLKAGTDMEYAAGEQSVVLMVPTAAWSTDLITALLLSLDQNGDIAATNTATFNSNIDVNDSSTAIRDSSNNEFIKFSKAASAVNELTLANAATGNSPSYTASGGDANVGIRFLPKGSGYIELGHTGAHVQTVSTTSSAVATGTTTIPQDDTIPQNTEGDEYMTLAVTPKSTTNILVIEAKVLLSTTNVAGSWLIAALFQDATAGALAANAQYQATPQGGVIISVTHRMVAGTTSATTFKIRGGAHNTGTTTFNGTGGNRLFGAIPKSSIVISEYKAS